tara:strand:+ start:2572 stop:3441 length:870 start_codon:yes stop_codon:yes gene_type:complete
MEKFSYSRINTYNQCPQKYKIQYIDKIYSSKNSIEAFMGNSVHYVLEKIYSIKNLKNQFISFDSLVDMYFDYWKKEWTDDIFISKFKYNQIKNDKSMLFHNKSIEQIYYEKMINDGKKCLSNYYKRFNDSGYFKQNIFAVEYEFKIKIGKYEFIGYIDRIDIDDDNTINIIDYKTGSKFHTLSKLKKDLQLYIYEMVIRNSDDFKNMENIILNLFYLKVDKYLSCVHDNKDVIKLEKKILDNIELIKSDKVFNGKESILCDWCFFWNECDYKSVNNPSIRINRNEFFNK